MIADRYDKISTLSKQTLLDEYQSSQSSKSIAQRLHISSSTVMRHTWKYVVQPRLKLPEVLATSAFKNLKSGLGKYACVLADPIHKKTIDVLPDRRYHHLINTFALILLEDRKKVKVVTSDLWESYPRTFPKAFPNVIPVQNHFIS